MSRACEMLLRVDTEVGVPSENGSLQDTNQRRYLSPSAKDVEAVLLSIYQMQSRLRFHNLANNLFVQLGPVKALKRGCLGS